LCVVQTRPWSPVCPPACPRRGAQCNIAYNTVLSRGAGRSAPVWDVSRADRPAARTHGTRLVRESERGGLGDRRGRASGKSKEQERKTQTPRGTKNTTRCRRRPTPPGDCLIFCRILCSGAQNGAARPPGPRYRPPSARRRRRQDGTDPNRAQGGSPHAAEEALAAARRRRREGKARKAEPEGHGERPGRRRRICPRARRGASGDRTWLKGGGAIRGVRNARGGGGPGRTPK